MREAIKPMIPAAEYWFAEGCHINERPNSDADPAVSIARVRVAPGITPRWHRLIDTTERYVLIAGQGRGTWSSFPPAAASALPAWGMRN